MLDKPVFVCSQICENGTGAEAARKSVEGVEDLGVMEQVWATAYDTTATNSSPAVGAAALIEHHRGCQILKCPCRRHIWDLFGKTISVVVSGQRTTGPQYPLFQRYARIWAEIMDTIDYGNLKRFDEEAWQGTFLEQVVADVKVWVVHAITSRSFKKGTHLNLLNLIAAYLNVSPPGFPFKFHKPETIDNARFGQKANIYITIDLLSPQLTFMTREQEQEVSTMSLIASVFFGPGFLKSPLLAKASFNDLTSIHHYRQLRAFLPDVSTAALKLWERHLDYVTPQHIPWSLVNNDFSDNARQELAKALLELLPQRVRQLPPTRVRYPGPAFCTGDQFWPQDGGLPLLGPLATPDSFLPFNIMELTDEDLREWWQAPVSQWSDEIASPNYKMAFKATKIMATKFEATNDNVESSLKALKDTIKKYHDEESLQHGLVTLFEERKLAPAETSGKISKKTLKNIVRGK